MEYTKRPTKQHIVFWTRERVVDGHPIPENWIICNAPRPLYGAEEWTGEFIKGIFYVAVDPDSEDAPFQLHRNAELNATELVFVTQEQCIEVAMAYYREYYPDTEIKQYNPLIRRHLVVRGLELMNDD